MKRFAVLLLCACSASLPAQATRIHESPDSVCEAFASCVKNADFGGILELSSFYGAERVARIDPEAVIKRFGALVPAAAEAFPLDYAELARVRLLSRYAVSVETICAVLLLPPEFSDFAAAKTVKADNEKDRVAFLGSMDSGRLKGLELVRRDPALPELQKNPRHLENVEKYKACYGYDEQVEYAMLYRLKGKLYMGGLVLARYGDSWYIDSLKGPLANLMELQEVPGVEEYEQRITYF